MMMMMMMMARRPGRSCSARRVPGQKKHKLDLPAAMMLSLQTSVASTKSFSSQFSESFGRGLCPASSCETVGVLRIPLSVCPGFAAQRQRLLARAELPWTCWETSRSVHLIHSQFSASRKQRTVNSVSKSKTADVLEDDDDDETFRTSCGARRVPRQQNPRLTLSANLPRQLLNVGVSSPDPAG